MLKPGWAALGVKLAVSEWGGHRFGLILLLWLRAKPEVGLLSSTWWHQLLRRCCSGMPGGVLAFCWRASSEWSASCRLHLLRSVPALCEPVLTHAGVKWLHWAVEVLIDVIWEQHTELTAHIEAHNESTQQSFEAVFTSWLSVEALSAVFEGTVYYFTLFLNKRSITFTAEKLVHFRTSFRNPQVTVLCWRSSHKPLTDAGFSVVWIIEKTGCIQVCLAVPLKVCVVIKGHHENGTYHCRTCIMKYSIGLKFGHTFSFNAVFYIHDFLHCRLSIKHQNRWTHLKLCP